MYIIVYIVAIVIKLLFSLLLYRFLIKSSILIGSFDMAQKIIKT